MINKYDWMNSILTSGIKALFAPTVIDMFFIRYLLERPQTLWFTLKRCMITMCQSQTLWFTLKRCMMTTCQSLLSTSVSTIIIITGNYITHSVLMD